jgi:glutamate racemase
MASMGSIGVFDSGFGGLSVLQAIRLHLPHESVTYFADSAHAPYGEKSDGFIKSRSTAVARWLVQEGAKILVVACNTATAHAIESLRGELKIPVVGVEPGFKPAVATSASGVIGVLATAATLRSERFQARLIEHGNTCRFVCQAGHGLVELIERGDTASPEVDALLLTYLTPMAEAGVDTVILGSTHFAWLGPSIRKLFGNRFRLIETRDALARRTVSLLDQLKLHRSIRGGATLRLCSSVASDEQLQRLEKFAAQFAGVGCAAESVQI